MTGLFGKMKTHLLVPMCHIDVALVWFLIDSSSSFEIKNSKWCQVIPASSFGACAVQHSLTQMNCLWFHCVDLIHIHQQISKPILMNSEHRQQSFIKIVVNYWFGRKGSLLLKFIPGIVKVFHCGFLHQLLQDVYKVANFSSIAIGFLLEIEMKISFKMVPAKNMLC